MAVEKPEVGRNIYFSYNLAKTIFAAMVVDFDDPINHQHIRGGEFGVFRSKQFTASGA